MHTGSQAASYSAPAMHTDSTMCMPTCECEADKEDGHRCGAQQHQRLPPDCEVLLEEDVEHRVGEHVQPQLGGQACRKVARGLRGVADCAGRREAERAQSASCAADVAFHLHLTLLLAAKSMPTVAATTPQRPCPPAQRAHLHGGDEVRLAGEDHVVGAEGGGGHHPAAQPCHAAGIRRVRLRQAVSTRSRAQQPSCRQAPLCCTPLPCLCQT